jgi:hypothetical protein
MRGVKQFLKPDAYKQSELGDQLSAVSGQSSAKLCEAKLRADG